MSDQSVVVKRIESIWNEFDSRAEQVGLAIARLELAKALAEAEELAGDWRNNWESERLALIQERARAEAAERERDELRARLSTIRRIMACTGWDEAMQAEFEKAING